MPLWVRAVGPAPQPGTLQADSFYHDTYTVSASGGVVTIGGNSGVSMASGLNYYLANAVNATVFWGNGDSGLQLALPATLPDFPTTTVVSPVRWRYYMNVCTVSYSAAVRHGLAGGCTRACAFLF
jgi:hypothetical protein